MNLLKRSLFVLSVLLVAAQAEALCAEKKTNSRASATHERDVATFLLLYEEDERHAARTWFHSHKELEREQRVLAQMGLNSAAVGWLDPALQFTQEAVQLKPNDPYALASLAWVLMKRGNAGNAMKFARQALQVKPDARSLGIMAEILEARGLKQDADTALKQAAVLDKNSFDLAASAARIRFSRLQDLSALKPLDQFIEKNPKHFRARIMRADLFVQLARGNPAVEDLTVVLKQKPTHTWALQMRASAYRRLKKYGLSDKDARAFLAIKGDHGRALLSSVEIAKCCEMAGDWQGAILARRDFIERQATFYKVNLNDGRGEGLPAHMVKPMLECVNTMMKTKEYDDAIKYLNVIVSRYPEETEALEKRANLLQLANRNKEALRDLTALLKEYPDYRHVYLSRAQVYEKLGDKEAARKDRAKAAKL
jgi:tetratricopeptide (TPR) repeat protein